MADEEPPEPKRCPFQDLYDGEVIVADIVSSIVDDSYEIIKEHYIRERLAAFSANSVLQDLFDVVRTGYLGRDAGDEDAPTSSEWVAEAEPESTSLDSWARGRVKVMAKPKEDDSRGDDARRMSRIRGRGLTSAGGRGRAKRETTFGDNTLSKIMEGPPGSPREDVGFKAFKTRGREDEFNPQVEAAHAKQVQLLEDMEKKVRDSKAKRERIKAEQKMAHDSLMRELKGKDYTFHSDGDVVVLNPPAYDSLAPVTTTPRINITEEEQLLRSDDSQARLRRQKKQKKKQKKTKPEIDNSDFYKEDDTRQPALIPNVQLVGGVDLYEGDKERRGPPVEPDPKHMNRREYMLQSAPPPETVPIPEPSVSLNDLEAQAEAEAAAAAAAAALAAANEPEPVDLTEVFMEEELTPHAPEPVLDKNMEMVKSETWGVNPVNAREYRPGPPPKKPNQKQRQLTAKMTGGERVKNPRDRPFITSSPRKKLPAPPLGKTTGHGHPTHGAPLSSSSLGFNNSEGTSLFPAIGGASSPIMSGTASPGPAPKSFKTPKQRMGGGQVVQTDIAKELLKRKVL